MNVYPTRTVDLSGALGAGAGFFELNIYDDAVARRFSLAIGGIESEGLRIPRAGLAAFQAAVGGPQLFVTPLIDFTGTGTYGINLGAMPGWYAFPVAMKLVAETVTATAGPTLTVGNGTGFGGTGIDNLAPIQGGWELASSPAIADIVLLSEAPLVNLTTPIQVRVQAAATGGSFSGFVAMLLQLFQFE